MTTLTLNRNLDAGDFMFVAMNDSTYADLKASRSMDSRRAEWECSQGIGETVGEKIRKFFRR